MSHVTVISRDALDPLLIQKYFSRDQADNGIIKCAFPHYSIASHRELRNLRRIRLRGEQILEIAKLS